MPRRSVRQRRRSRGCLSALIGLTAMTALVLAAAVFITENMDLSRFIKTDKIKVNENVITPAPITTDDVNNSMVLNANTFSKTNVPDVVINTPIPTPTPTPAPTATPSPEPTYNPAEPYALVRPQPQEEGFLPVFKKANTERKQIAITLYECSGASITRDFCQLAMNYGAKLTLFPLGQNVLVTNMDTVLRKCVFELGFEVENACYSYTSRLFRMNDEEMAMEIWKQNMALNYVLGVDYQPNFLSVFGGNGNNDPRTHAYLKQEGYKGFAGWSVVAADVSYNDIIQTLQPGAIYYFKTNEEDAAKMERLMMTAKKGGYEMVTLNELFGYDPNHYEQVEGSVLNETLPLLENYDGDYYNLKSGYSTWAVYKLQERLCELGYLTEESVDGVYGDGTLDAVCLFQANNGIAASGMASVETQEVLYSDKAVRKK